MCETLDEIHEFQLASVIEKIRKEKLGSEDIKITVQ